MLKINAVVTIAIVDEMKMALLICRVRVLLYVKLESRILTRCNERAD